MNRERNALPPPPPHPARLANKSPSYYLPPRISSQNQSTQFSTHSLMNSTSQQIPLHQPAYQQYHYPNVIDNEPQVYAPQQNVPITHNLGSQPQIPSTHPYQGGLLQSPKPPISQQTNAFSHQTVLPAASNVKSSFFSTPVRKTRPESMPPLPSNSFPKSGLSSFLPAATMVNHLPSISVIPNSSTSNITSAAGTLRRPLPTPSPTRTKPSNVAGSTAVSDTQSSFRQDSFPLTRNQSVFPIQNSQHSSPSHSRTLPSSPVSPPDLSKLRLGNDSDPNSRVILQMERRNDIASIRAKFENNSGSTPISMRTSSPSRTESPALQEENVSIVDSHLDPKTKSMTNGNYQNEYSISRSPSPTSPLYGILDLPSRSRGDSRPGHVVSPSQQSETVVYAPSPVRAERALQSSGIGSDLPDLDVVNKSMTSNQTNRRQSNIYKLASSSLDNGIKEDLHSEIFGSGPYTKSKGSTAPKKASHINETSVYSSSEARKALSYDVSPAPVIHAPPTHTGSTSNRPIITLTSKVQVDTNDANFFEQSRRTQTVIPSISIPDADVDDDVSYGYNGPTISVADYSANSQSSNDRSIPYMSSNSEIPTSPSKYRHPSPNGMKRSLPPPPPSPQRQSTPTSTYDPRSGPRGGELVCGGCGQAIVGRIVSAVGRRWHPQCFKCSDCGELLEHVSAYEHDGHPFCHLDYHEHFAPRCYHCKTPIVEERFITLDDPALGKRAYHEQHFFCAECGDPFLTPSIPQQSVRKSGEISVSGDGEFDLDEDDVGFTVYKGHPYCEACHVRLRMPKCKMCKKSIRPGMHALEALGGKWCWECFVCAACEKPFQNPSFFQRDQKPYCEPCFSLMLRNEI